MHQFAKPAAVVLFCINLSTKALAVPISFELAGTVSAVDPQISSHYALGSDVRIRVSYDSAGPYIATTQANIGSITLNGLGHLVVQNNAPYDEFIVAYAEMFGHDISSYDRPLLYINFVDYTSSIYNSNSLPITFPPLSYWSYVLANVRYEDRPQNTSYLAYFDITSMRLVPEPSTTALITAGIALIGYAAARANRKP